MFIQCDKILFYKLTGDILHRYKQAHDPFLFIYQSSFMRLFTVTALIKLNDGLSRCKKKQIYRSAINSSTKTNINNFSRPLLSYNLDEKFEFRLKFQIRGKNNQTTHAQKINLLTLKHLIG